MIRVFLALAAFALLAPSLAQAGGSVSFQDDIAPLLAARPDLAAKLEGLHLAEMGDGLRIGNRICPALGGKRIGPYEFAATDAADHAETVTFFTRDSFFDARGALVAVYERGAPVGSDDISTAATVREELIDITIGNGAP